MTKNQILLLTTAAYTIGRVIGARRKAKQYHAMIVEAKLIHELNIENITNAAKFVTDVRDGMPIDEAYALYQKRFEFVGIIAGGYDLD